jgi:hypothetical protein
MKLDKSFFHSKLARRLFLMFVACALLPIAGLFMLSLTQVTNQLYEQNHRRLKQSVKFHGLSIYERLLFIDAEMQVIASSFDAETLTDIRKLPDARIKKRLADRFGGLFLYQAGKRYRSFFGETKDIPCPSSEQLEHTASGKPAIITKYPSDALPKIFILRQITTDDTNAVFLIEEVNPSYLWGADNENFLPPDVNVCVLDESKRLLFSTVPDQLALSADALPAIRSSMSDLFDLMLNNDRYRCNQKPMCLPPWRILRRCSFLSY